jgi:hypothetical protein
MNVFWFLRVFTAFTLSLGLLAAGFSQANGDPLPLSPGNVIIGGPLMPPGTAVHEYQPDGTYVQIIPLQHPTSNVSPGQLTFDRAGALWIFNGDLDPHLTSWNPESSSWAHLACPEWNTFLCFPCQGMGLNRNYVFATDMSVLGDANGIVRFDRNDAGCTRFGQGADYSSLSLVGEGMIYALRAETSSPPETSIVDVFDPNSLALLGSIELSVRSLTIAVDANGILHGANGTDILRYKEDGAVLDAYKVIDEGFLYTLSRARDGRFIAVSNAGEVVITGADLVPQSRFYNIAGTFGYATLVPERLPDAVTPEDIPIPALSITTFWFLIAGVSVIGLYVLMRKKLTP